MCSATPAMIRNRIFSIYFVSQIIENLACIYVAKAKQSYFLGFDCDLLLNLLYTYE